MKFKVKVKATITADIWVQCSDEQEAKSIAEYAWNPYLNGACVNPTVEAVYNYDVYRLAADVHATDVEEL